MTVNDYLEKIAKSLTHLIFRNGIVENIHSKGYLSEEQMKQLNKDVYNRIYTLLVMNDGCLNCPSKELEEHLDTIIHFNTFFGSNWDKPEITKSITGEELYEITMNYKQIIEKEELKN